MGERRHPFCRMVDYSGEWLGLYSPNVMKKRFYKMVTAFCRMHGVHPPILQNGTPKTFPFCRMEVNQQEKNRTILTMRLWTTGEMMNGARIQMELWVEKKNEHTATVQRRWDNTGKMNKAFKR
eukprot:3830478-Pleurochrysis_carterae.AAC.1